MKFVLKALGKIWIILPKAVRYFAVMLSSLTTGNYFSCSTKWILLPESINNKARKYAHIPFAMDVLEVEVLPFF